MEQIFSEFTGIKSGDQTSFSGTGDVKYHLGTSYVRPTITGKRVHLSLLANPSHLEVSLLIVSSEVRKQCWEDCAWNAVHMSSLNLLIKRVYGGLCSCAGTKGLASLVVHSVVCVMNP